MCYIYLNNIGVGTNIRKASTQDKILLIGFNEFLLYITVKLEKQVLSLWNDILLTKNSSY